MSRTDSCCINDRSCSGHIEWYHVSRDNMLLIYVVVGSVHRFFLIWVSPHFNNWSVEELIPQSILRNFYYTELLSRVSGQKRHAADQFHPCNLEAFFKGPCKALVHTRANISPHFMRWNSLILARQLWLLPPVVYSRIKYSFKICQDKRWKLEVRTR